MLPSHSLFSLWHFVSALLTHSSLNFVTVGFKCCAAPTAAHVKVNPTRTSPLVQQPPSFLLAPGFPHMKPVKGPFTTATCCKSTGRCGPTLKSFIELVSYAKESLIRVVLCAFNSLYITQYSIIKSVFGIISSQRFNRSSC